MTPFVSFYICIVNLLNCCYITRIVGEARKKFSFWSTFPILDKQTCKTKLFSQLNHSFSSIVSPSSQFSLLALCKLSTPMYQPTMLAQHPLNSMEQNSSVHWISNWFYFKLAQGFSIKLLMELTPSTLVMPLMSLLLRMMMTVMLALMQHLLSFPNENIFIPFWDHPKPSFWLVASISAD